MGINIASRDEILAEIYNSFILPVATFPLTLALLLTLMVAATATLTHRFGLAEPLTPKDES